MTLEHAQLLDALREVELPTLGHFIEDGFVDPRVHPVTRSPQLVGFARTLDLREPDAYEVNRALLAARPGEVLVIRVAGGAHAPVGAVTARAAIAQGAVGIVVDGPVTDVQALRETQDRFAVYATGLTARTTKRTGTLAGSAVDQPVVIGGVPVSTGDLVLGDAHGVLVLPGGRIDPEVLSAARASDRDEPELLARIAAGESLASLLPIGP
ncbi:RraA family protein [Leucobacter sp. USHLN154]|uniref:RraA family protein n=1 Tax=Leucobacter sp. USHLN154 TaxID=3081269 RepID=UPI00301A3DBC